MKHFVVTFFLLAGVTSYSAERFEFYKGARGLAMGNATTAVVNDETALLLNPAGLGKLRNVFGTILDPELDLSSSALSIYRAQSFANPVSMTQVVPAAASAVDEYYYARGQVFPSFVARNFGIGIFAKNELAALAASDTSVKVFYRDDISLLLGYNFRFWDGRVKFGLTGKMISRTEVNQESIDPTTQALDLGSLNTAGLVTHGLGVGGDAGLMLTAPWDNLPTLAVVVHDVGNTNFDKTYVSRLSTTDHPAQAKQDADVGMSFTVIHKSNIRTVWTIEQKGVLTMSSEDDKAKLYHAGIETNLSDIFFFRVGYNQRYVTFGLEIASEKFQFQFASYEEEVGTVDSPRGDRRSVAKFAFRF